MVKILRSFSAACLLLLSACQAGSDIDGLAEPSTQSVQETSGYPAVVRVVMPLGAGFCTGTFISPKAVLTAAHCTQNAGIYTVITDFGTFLTNTIVNLGDGSVADTTDISLVILNADEADPDQSQVLPIGYEPYSLDTIRVIGYGCNNIDTKTGAGVKRTGTNQVYQVNSFIELLTPRTSTGQGVLGPENRAGACFGDSGGPMLVEKDGVVEVVGVAHAGSWNNDLVLSQYANLNQNENLTFLQDNDSTYNLDINSGCAGCHSSFASTGLMGFLKMIWSWLQLKI